MLYDGVFGGRSERSTSKSVILFALEKGRVADRPDCEPDEEDEPLAERAVAGGMTLAK